MFTEYKKMFTDFAVSSEDLTVRTIMLFFKETFLYFKYCIYTFFSKYIMHAFVFLDIECNRFVPDLDMDSKRSKPFFVHFVWSVLSRSSAQSQYTLRSSEYRV